MKRKLLPLLVLLLCFLFTGCDEDAPNFSYDKELMTSQSKSIVDQCYNLTDVEKDYVLSEGDDYMKDMVSGLKQTENTDKVGKLVGFNTSEDSSSIVNSNDGTVLCSIIAKFENRDARINITYKENKLYTLQKTSILEQFSAEAVNAGYDPDGYAKMIGFNSAEEFVENYISQNSGTQPYTPVECEVSAVYSTSELLINGAKNMGVGMGVVFCVLIFIAFIISLLKFVPRIFGKGEKKKEEPKPQVKVEKPVLPQPEIAAKAAVPAVGEEVEDTELIAVITAALHAYLSEEGVTYHPPAYTASNDGLVVRSIRRVR